MFNKDEPSKLGWAEKNMIEKEICMMCVYLFLRVKYEMNNVGKET